MATAAIEVLYGAVAENPHRTGAPLRLGLEGLYSARRGDYRILYAIDDDNHVVRVVTLEHRSDVYRPSYEATMPSPPTASGTVTEPSGVSEPLLATR